MSTHEHAPLGGRLVTAPFVFLVIIGIIAAFVLTQRFVFGLGAVTNLNDGYPWGIWISVDLIIGTAFGCGGFVMAFLVYIINKGEYHPLARAGLMTALFGYTLGAVAVMIDLGRWWQGYNILFPGLWNSNSVLLETALCIFAYIVVLLIEFAPSFLERFGMTETRRRLQKVLFVFAALGVLLPMMHQSSMGTVVVILGYQLSPLWQSQFLTLLFLLTAITMGFGIVTFESITSSAAFKRPYEITILSKLGNIAMWVMLVFVSLRIIDVLRLGAFPLAFRGDIQALFFWIELAAGAGAIACLATERYRRSPRMLFLGSALVLTNGFIYRLSCYLIGYDPGNGYHYYPSLSEILVTLGIVALHVILYLVFVKMLPVLHTVRTSPPTQKSPAQATS